MILIGIICGCLVIFLNYIIGKPASEFSPYEIFSGYTVWLAKRRLKEIGIYDQYSEQYHDNLNRIETKAGKIKLENDFKKMVYDAAEPFFTWERAAGMCPVCFGYWVSLIGGLYFTINLVHLITIVVVSHVTIRTLSKFL